METCALVRIWAHDFGKFNFLWKTGSVSLLQRFIFFSWKKILSVLAFAHYLMPNGNHLLGILCLQALVIKPFSLEGLHHHSTHYRNYIKEGKSAAKSVLPSLYHCPYLALGRLAEQTTT